VSTYRAFEPLVISNWNTDIHNIFLFVGVQCAPELFVLRTHPTPPAATRQGLSLRLLDLAPMAVRAAGSWIGRFVPFNLAGGTPQWTAWFRLDWPTLDFERLAENDCLGDLAARDFYDPSESRARDSHPFCRLILIEPLEISQSDSLEFVESHHYLCEHARRNSSRLEYRRRRLPSYSAATWRPGHK
jgi:hypothetical protein